jgi:putative flavoprotein involved in K+ transport
VNRTRQPERIETVIIGGGQAGLATGYFLQRRQRPFVILDGHQRVGDNWRKRWDSLRLFTPATLSHLPGMRQPRPSWGFATKDEFADYLESYARHFGFDVRSGAHVDGIERRGDGYLVRAGEQCFEADHVVLATGGYQEPKVPVFAPDLDPAIVQLHSSAYRNPGQLQTGPVLVVGAGNSGAEIALELAAAGHEAWMAGGKVPAFPVRPTSAPARIVMPVFFFAASRLLTMRTPVGRRMRPRVQEHAAPLIRVKPRDLDAAGVRRVLGRVVGVRDGRPELEDGTRCDVANVIWCTGFRTNFGWIDLPAFVSGELPEHDRGVLREEPGIYMVGQRFQHALSSSFIKGVGRDADHIARAIAKRAGERDRVAGRERRAAAAEVAGGTTR